MIYPLHRDTNNVQANFDDAALYLPGVDQSFGVEETINDDNFQTLPGVSQEIDENLESTLDTSNNFEILDTSDNEENIDRVNLLLSRENRSEDSEILFLNPCVMSNNSDTHNGD